jgi:hypothetical protein
MVVSLLIRFLRKASSVAGMAVSRCAHKVGSCGAVAGGPTPQSALAARAVDAFPIKQQQSLQVDSAVLCCGLQELASALSIQ